MSTWYELWVLLWIYIPPFHAPHLVLILREQGLKKTIPDAMGIPIHERQTQIFAHGGGSMVHHPGGRLSRLVDAKVSDIEHIPKGVEDKLSKDTPPAS